MTGGRFWLITLFCVCTAAVQAAEHSASVAAARHAAPDGKLLDEARGLLAANRGPEAYALLAPHEEDWAGDRDFDYLFGAAAVDSHHPDEAVLALQRAVAS